MFFAPSRAEAQIPLVDDVEQSSPRRGESRPSTFGKGLDNRRPTLRHYGGCSVFVRRPTGIVTACRGRGRWPRGASTPRARGLVRNARGEGRHLPWHFCIEGAHSLVGLVRCSSRRLRGRFPAARGDSPRNLSAQPTLVALIAQCHRVIGAVASGRPGRRRTWTWSAAAGPALLTVRAKLSPDAEAGVLRTATKRGARVGMLPASVVGFFASAFLLELNESAGLVGLCGSKYDLAVRCLGGGGGSGDGLYGEVGVALRRCDRGAGLDGQVCGCTRRAPPWPGRQRRWPERCRPPTSQPRVSDRRCSRVDRWSYPGDRLVAVVDVAGGIVERGGGGFEPGARSGEQDSDVERGVVALDVPVELGDVLLQAVGGRREPVEGMLSDPTVAYRPATSTSASRSSMSTVGSGPAASACTSWRTCSLACSACSTASFIGASPSCRACGQTVAATTIPLRGRGR